MEYFDAHCHLNCEPLLEQHEKSLANFRLIGLKANVVGTNLTNSQIAVNLAKQHPDLLKAGVGIHPNDVQLFDLKAAQATLKKLVSTHRSFISCIGEYGFDYHYTKDYITQQEQFFLMQFQLAEQYQLVHMLHVRDVHERIYEVLKRLKPKQPVVFHCFSEDTNTALKLLTLREVGLKVYFSIPGIVTFKNAKNLQAALSVIPTELLLSETDSPYLAPVPFRGKTNWPECVVHTVKTIADIKQVPLAEIKQAIVHNAKKLFW